MTLLMGTAVFIAFFHSLLGPDHYLPFIVMAKAGKMVHGQEGMDNRDGIAVQVASFVLLGFIGIALGAAIKKPAGGGIVSRQPRLMGADCLRIGVFCLGAFAGHGRTNRNIISTFMPADISIRMNTYTPKSTLADGTIGLCGLAIELLGL